MRREAPTPSAAVNAGIDQSSCDQPWNSAFEVTRFVVHRPHPPAPASKSASIAARAGLLWAVPRPCAASNSEIPRVDLGRSARCPSTTRERGTCPVDEAPTAIDCAKSPSFLANPAWPRACAAESRGTST